MTLFEKILKLEKRITKLELKIAQKREVKFFRNLQGVELNLVFNKFCEKRTTDRALVDKTFNQTVQKG